MRIEKSSLFLWMLMATSVAKFEVVPRSGDYFFDDFFIIHSNYFLQTIDF